MEYSLTKQMGFLFVGRFVAFSFVFAIPLVLVRVFSPEEFGLYKQLFLIHETLSLSLTLGLSASIFYFIPHYPSNWRAYLYQTLFILGCLGMLGAGGLVAFKSQVAGLLNNPDLEFYIPYLATYTGISLLTANLENIMVVLKHSRLVAWTIALSDFLRAFLMIGAAIWAHSMLVLVLAALGWMICRLIMLLLYLRTLGVSWWVRPELARVTEQFRYSIPFGLAVMLVVFSDSLHQYVVSYKYNPALFAIYSVGCLQIPVISMVYSSVSEVTLVRLMELLKDGNLEECVQVIGESVGKLCLLLIPLYVWVTVNARDVIVFLFTERFEESADIVKIFLGVILLAVFQLDYVPRAFADTRFILQVNIVRFVLTTILLFVLTGLMGMHGAALAVVLALGATKLLIVLKVKALLHTDLKHLFPWRQLGRIGTASVMAGLVTWIFQDTWSLNVGIKLFLSGGAFTVVYAILAWKLNGIEPHQKLWVTGRLHKFTRLSVGV